MKDLADLPFFTPFQPETLAGLATVARWRSYEAGQVVLEADEDTQDVFFVADGMLRVFARSSGGHEIILNDIGPGAVVGEIAAIDGARRSAHVVALTPARLCAIPGGAFMDFALATPTASLHLMRTLAALVRDKDTRILELSVLPVRPRLIALLLRLARPRPAGGLVVSPPRPHHELAARIGTRREVVSRAMSALRRAGLLAQGRGGLVVPRPDALRLELHAAWSAALSA
ncbi:MAG: Crp/Fnr family transcriptional regulator [Acetobacteraceae bacterium]